MLKQIPSEDYDLIIRVRELAQRGYTQTAISEEMGEPLGTIRSRFAKHGLTLSAGTHISVTWTNEPFESVFARGEIVRAPVAEQPSELAESMAA